MTRRAASAPRRGGSPRRGTRRGDRPTEPVRRPRPVGCRWPRAPSSAPRSAPPGWVADLRPRRLRARAHDRPARATRSRRQLGPSRLGAAGSTTRGSSPPRPRLPLRRLTDGGPETDAPAPLRPPTRHLEAAARLADRRARAGLAALGDKLYAAAAPALEPASDQVEVYDISRRWRTRAGDGLGRNHVAGAFLGGELSSPAAARARETAASRRSSPTTRHANAGALAPMAPRAAASAAVVTGGRLVALAARSSTRAGDDRAGRGLRRPRGPRCRRC